MDRLKFLFAAVLMTTGTFGAPVELVRKGDFSPAKGVTFADSPEGREMVISKPGGHCAWRIKLDPKWAVLNLKGEMRVTDVPSGKFGWQTGRFAMEWKDAKGRTVGPWPRNEGLVGTTDWVKYDYDNYIPTNAAYLAISLCNLASGGEVRFRNFSLTIRRDRMNSPGNAPLPAGAPADAESLAGAWKAETPTRVRYSMNGLWRIRPAFAGEADGAVPGADDNWAWDRIPAIWPGNGSFDASRHLSPWFEDHPERLSAILPERAWYARTFTMPRESAGRRAFLSFDMIASRATVYVDGRRAGVVEFPNGEVEITEFVKPGERQTLALDVTAYAQGDTWNYNEATRANKERKVVKFKGVTGDLWLDLTPKATRIVDAFAETSVEKGEITFCAEIEGGAKPTVEYFKDGVSVGSTKPTAYGNYVVKASVTAGGRSPAQKELLRMKNTLCRQGCYESIFYSFFSPKDLDMLRLPEDVLARLREEGLSERHARALLRLGDAEEQRTALDFIIDQRMNVAAAEEYIVSVLPEKEIVVRLIDGMDDWYAI